jgi:hypothetical protein
VITKLSQASGRRAARVKLVTRTTLDAENPGGFVLIERRHYRSAGSLDGRVGQIGPDT